MVSFVYILYDTDCISSLSNIHCLNARRSDIVTHLQSS